MKNMIVFLLFLSSCSLQEVKETAATLVELQRNYCASTSQQEKVENLKKVHRVLPSWPGICMDYRLESINNNKVYEY